MPILLAAAKMANGEFDREKIKEEFRVKYGYAFDEFMNLELPNITEEEESHYHSPCKYFLYNDPFLGIFDFSAHKDLPRRYAEAAERLSASINGRTYDYLFDVEQKLLRVLSKKCDLGVRLREAYKADDRESLQVLAEQEFPQICKDMEAFVDAFRNLWLRENKAFGLEVQEIRLGGLLFRMEMCRQRLVSYLNNEVYKIDELEEKNLSKYSGFEGKGFCYNQYKSIVTASVF